MMLATAKLCLMSTIAYTYAIHLEKAVLQLYFMPTQYILRSSDFRFFFLSPCYFRIQIELLR